MFTVQQLKQTLTSVDVRDDHEVVFFPTKSDTGTNDTLTAQLTTAIVSPTGAIAVWTGNADDFGFTSLDEMKEKGCVLKQVLGVFIYF